MSGPVDKALATAPMGRPGPLPTHCPGTANVLMAEADGNRTRQGRASALTGFEVPTPLGNRPIHRKTAGQSL